MVRVCKLDLPMQDDKLIATHHMPPRTEPDVEAKYPGMNLALPPI